MKYFVILALLVAGYARAEMNLTSETTSGNSSFIEAISASGDLGSQKGPSTWSWNSALTLSTTKITDGTTGTRTVTDRTTEIAGGAVWDYDHTWDIGMGLVYSRTPDENLVNSGGNVDFSFTHEYGHAEKEQKDDDAKFFPYFTAKLGFASLRYVQTYGLTTRRSGVSRPTTGENTIKQNQSNISFKYKPLDWFKVRLIAEKYTYDRDVTAFLSALDSTRVARTGRAEFASAVSGLPDSSSTLEFSFYPGQTWEIVASGTSSLSAYDATKSSSGTLQVNKDIGKAWRVGLGVQSQKSEASALNPDPINESLGILLVSYDFQSEK